MTTEMLLEIGVRWGGSGKGRLDSEVSSLSLDVESESRISALLQLRGMWQPLVTAGGSSVVIVRDEDGFPKLAGQNQAESELRSRPPHPPPAQRILLLSPQPRSSEISETKIMDSLPETKALRDPLLESSLFRKIRLERQTLEFRVEPLSARLESYKWREGESPSRWAHSFLVCSRTR